VTAPHSPDPDWRRIAQSGALQIGCVLEVYYYVILRKLSQRPPAKWGRGTTSLVFQTSTLTLLVPRTALFMAEALDVVAL